nr:GntR family transcriptional regulator [Acuticoccus mangrovi]
MRDALEEEIVMGALRPGDRLEEPALAARFGVSRTPIREALLQLAGAGLIEIGPRRGASVAAIGPRRLVEMFDVMAELEAMCASLAARRASAEEIAAIREAHAACGAATRTSLDAYYYENEVFHERIRTASHHGFLIEQATALQKRLKPYRRLQLRVRGRMDASWAEHARVVDALAAGDAEAAAAAMRDHVVVQGARFTDLIVSMEAEAAP